MSYCVREYADFIYHSLLNWLTEYSIVYLLVNLYLCPTQGQTNRKKCGDCVSPIWGSVCLEQGKVFVFYYAGLNTDTEAGGMQIGSLNYYETSSVILARENAEKFTARSTSPSINKKINLWLDFEKWVKLRTFHRPHILLTNCKIKILKMLCFVVV